uniref:SRCR domain-containing protein n=1 Tax=Strigops habroptila TaxID=2489341 RepID=A0A672TS56_STRHB
CWFTMVPVGVLGVLLWVQLSEGQPWSTPEPQAELSTPQGPGELRLVGGGGRCAGRVEVMHEGEWGSVCKYEFDWDARWATVVCRQLGCGSVAMSSPYAPFGIVPISDGDNTSATMTGGCRLCRDTRCVPQRWAWLRLCRCHRADAVELRLVDGGGPCAGMVEVKLRGHWGSVTDDNWDMADAEVVCQQLGCGSATRAYISSSRLGQDDSLLSLVLVNCRGDEEVLWDCEVRGWGPYSGIHDFDTGVVCQGFTRLVGGDGTCSGRLEVRQRRAWVGVCEDAVDMNAAQVICRELGCGTALAVHGTGLFEAGAEPQWDVGFECTGTEHLLSACSRRAARSRGCTSHASIICSCKRRGHRGRWGSPRAIVTPQRPFCHSLHRVPAGEPQLALRRARGGDGRGDVGVPLCHQLGPARCPCPLPPPRLRPRHHRAPGRLLRQREWDPVGGCL